MSENNPWLVDYQGVWARSMEVNAVAKEYEGVIADYESKLQAWKKHSQAQEKDFNEAIKQRNQRECQAFAWRDVARKLMDRYPDLTKEQVNAMYDEIRNSYYDNLRAAGRPV